MKNILEKIIEDKSYDDLGNWRMPCLEKFSDTKKLYEYQKNGLKNITKVLHEYFSAEDGRKVLEEAYHAHGLDKKSFAVEKYESKQKKQGMQINKKFSFFQNYFPALGGEGEEYISGSSFLNRACFWMATGSGKSLVIIKTIEALDYLQSQKLIPEREMMLLLPREDLIKQFKREVNEYNKSRDRKIELIDLKKYEDDKQAFDFRDTVKVYFYRSDLLRDIRKENILDYRTYENNGNWYVFLDEAHRGGADESLMKNYVSALSKNGFLFNFSATFTESIDYAATCFNFNLEKFINAGYGKNLYLTNSYFDFNKDRDDFSEREKQKQLLKSLITFTLVKKSKKKDTYHHPLLIALVNSVNTDDADLLLLFEKLEEIAGGRVEKKLFEQAREEILDDLTNHREYIFGDESLEFEKSMLEKLEVKDVFENVFNAKSNGKIDILEGEKGKEIALKLQTSDRPFALIKIGDTKKFQREKLGKNYNIETSFENKKYFEKINHSENLNLLLGSRSFYEGWDSNRPNIINLINIGKKDAKKFVLQGIGRGIRIEPHKGERKRLPETDKDKNKLLETLFVFATDKNAVKAIIETVEEQKSRDEIEIALFENEKKPFGLLLPVYKEENTRGKIGRFNIEKNSLSRFINYFESFDKNTLLVKTGISREDFDFLFEEFKNGNLFQISEENIYSDMDMLLERIVAHISAKRKVVEGLKRVENEIIHFKHIKAANLSDEEIKSLNEKINRVKNFEKVDKKELENKVKSGEISFEEAMRFSASVEEDSFKDLKIKKLAKHYYLPIIYVEKEKLDYIKHIINVPSEVKFIKNLEKHVGENKIDAEWMFSKIDESIDSFHIPYFSRKNNAYQKFFPDFIFWIKKGEEYKIVFIDPKGTSNADYQNKIDEFEKLFFEGEKAKVFEYKKFKVRFDLKLIARDVNSVGEKYEKYWAGEEDFRFLGI